MPEQAQPERNVRLTAVAFIDCRTREIYPIEEDIVEFYIGDYAIHRLDSDGNSYRYLIFFAPER